MKKNVLIGVLFVGLGASSYGMLTTIVKLAYRDGYSTAEVTTAQFIIGIVGLLLLVLFQKRKSNSTKKKVPIKKDIYKLILAGTSFGGTSIFYYLSVQYINVSIAIILLMQSVWFSVVLEAVLERKFPSVKKISASCIVLLGTVLATNVLNTSIELDYKGIMWGLFAATSYTITMYTSNKIATYLHPIKKSLYMLCGGLLLVIPFLFFTQIGPYHFSALRDLYASFSATTSLHAFDYSIFYTYGIILAVFGTILPPIFLNKGFPHAGLGLGSIVSSMELPVSVLFAYVLLNERMIAIQWLGVALILSAVVLMNISLKKKGNN